MRKVLLAFSVILLFVVTGSVFRAEIFAEEPVVSAEDETVTPKPTKITVTKPPKPSPIVTKAIKAATEEKKEAYLGAKNEYKNSVENAVQAKATLRFRRVVVRFNAAIGRLQRIQARVETRLSLMTGTSAEKSKAQGYVDEAEAQIAAGQGLVNDAIVIFNDMKTETAQEDFNSIQSLMQEAKLKLVAAKQSLAKAIGVMKGLRTGQSTIKPAISIISEPTEVLETTPTSMP